ncbi:uncharacterized protein LOC116665515 [Camelus ferus]|uniref:Uncharacterized protein LOC116665515 n=1 Tax=Camelus ferus TaxID=419612 RepID=A0A8B8TGF0_CAMFR|nr:uncharacterized protein LOC116665515 [Camelus ferus]
MPKCAARTVPKTACQPPGTARPSVGEGVQGDAVHLIPQGQAAAAHVRAPRLPGAICGVLGAGLGVCQEARLCSAQRAAPGGHPRRGTAAFALQGPQPPVGTGKQQKGCPVFCITFQQGSGVQCRGRVDPRELRAQPGPGSSEAPHSTGGRAAASLQGGHSGDVLGALEGPGPGDPGTRLHGSDRMGSLSGTAATRDKASPSSTPAATQLRVACGMVTLGAPLPGSGASAGI